MDLWILNLLICGLSLGFICRFRSVETTEIQTYGMNEMCGKYLNFIWKSVYMAELTFDPHLDDGDDHTKFVTSCDLDIASWRHMDQLMIRITRLEFKGDCSQSYLQVLDGLYPSAPSVEGLPPTICRENAANVLHSTAISTDRHLKIRFHGNTSEFKGERFSLLLVPYHSGKCESYEYQCDNGRCIWGGVVCNGYNPCGDMSDCNTPPPEIRIRQIAERVANDNQTLVVALVSSAVLLVIAIIVLVVFFRCYRKRKLEHLAQQRSNARHEAIPTSDNDDVIDIQLFQSPPSYNSLEPLDKSATPTPRVTPNATPQITPAGSECGDECASFLSRSQQNSQNLPTASTSVEPCEQEEHYCLSKNSPRWRSESPPPPSYHCVMTHKDKFYLSTPNINYAA